MNADAPEADDRPIFRMSMQRYVTMGFVTVAVLVLGFGGWAAATNIAGAVVAPGYLVVSSNVKEVQHREGGIVSGILVANGDAVAADDLLVTLDDTQPRAGRDLVEAQLFSLQARLDRLGAERDGKDTVVFRRSLLDRDGDPDLTDAMASQTGAFAARKASLVGQTGQLQEQINQLEEQITGLDLQRTAKRQEIALVANELEDLRQLQRRDIVPRSRVTEREREAVRLQGEDGDLTARIATARGRIAEISLQVLQTETEFQRTVLEEIAEVQTEVATLAERNVAASDELSRIEIRAPVAGVVHELAISTVGGVVQPGATLLTIVPQTDDLVVEVRVAPINIDEIHPGQPADVMFSGLSSRSTPRLSGAVSRVSADIIRDERTQQEFFKVRVTLPETERARLGDVVLLPGMPASAFIKTRDRTVLDYLVEPLMKAANITFRES